MSILSQIALNSIVIGSIYALVALSFNLIFGVTKFFNLSHGALVVIGGYMTFVFSRMLGSNILLSIVAAIVFTGLIGYIIDKLVYLPLRRRRASNMILLVASLGVFTVIQAVIALIFTSQHKSLLPPGISSPTYPLGGGVVTHPQILTFLTVVVVTAGLIFLLNKTTFGKSIKAISDDEEVAKIVGINTNKVIAQVFFIGSALAGVAGVAIGFDTGLQPTIGLPLLLAGIVAVIIGGIGNPYGAILGAFLLASIENFSILLIPGAWKPAITFAVLILFLLFRPRGILKQ